MALIIFVLAAWQMNVRRRGRRNLQQQDATVQNPNEPNMLTKIPPWCMLLKRVPIMEGWWKNAVVYTKCFQTKHQMSMSSMENNLLALRSQRMSINQINDRLWEIKSCDFQGRSLHWRLNHEHSWELKWKIHFRIFPSSFCYHWQGLSLLQGCQSVWYCLPCRQ